MTPWTTTDSRKYMKKSNVESGLFILWKKKFARKKCGVWGLYCLVFTVRTHCLRVAMAQRRAAMVWSREVTRSFGTCSHAARLGWGEEHLSAALPICFRAGKKSKLGCSPSLTHQLVWVRSDHSDWGTETGGLRKQLGHPGGECPESLGSQAAWGEERANGT